jgi:nucleotide-binding universal stress UspA family protein
MPRSSFRHILVPHDFSAEADGALRLAARLPGAARLSVLHVVEPFYQPMDPIYAALVPAPQSLVPGQRRILERRVRKVLGGRGPRVTVSVVVGLPATEIVKAAKHADLVVMPTLGRTGIAHVVIGSVAERVVRLSPAPVLTIRAPGGRRAKRR